RPAEGRVTVEGRPPLAFEALSLGVGSVPVCPADMAADPRFLPMRPLAGLVRRLDALERERERARGEARAFRFVVVGGGASGAELALAVHRRLGGTAGF